MNPAYKLYHPRWHRRRTPIFWWLGKPAYTKFIARELTSLGVLYAALLLTGTVCVLSRGEEAFARFQAFLRHPAALAFHGLVLAVLLFHTVTWLNLAPRALVVKVGGRRLPDGAIIAAHYAAWAAASALVAVFLLGGLG